MALRERPSGMEMGSELKEEGELHTTTVQENNRYIDPNLLPDGGTNPTTRTDETPKMGSDTIFSYKEVFWTAAPGNHDQMKVDITDHIPVKPGSPATYAKPNATPNTVRGTCLSFCASTTRNVPNSRINGAKQFSTKSIQQKEMNESRSRSSLRIKKEDQSITEQAPA